MGQDEWYKRAQWDINIPCNDLSFEQSTEEIQLNYFSFSLTISTIKQEVTDYVYSSVLGKYRKIETVSVPSIVLKYKPVSKVSSQDCKTEWKVHCSRFPPRSDEKRQFSYKGNSIFNQSKTEHQLDKTASYSQSCWWMKESGASCQLVVTVSLKEPLGKPEVDQLQPTFAEEWGHSDVVFIVESTEVHAHRQILALYSPVFNAMLFQDFQEKQSSRIDLPGKSHGIFVEFLRYIYPQCKPIKLQVDSALELIGLFHEYQVSGLEDQARNVLLQGLNTENAMDCLTVAELYDYGDLKHKALRTLGTVPMAELQEQKLFRDAEDHLQILIRDARIWYLEHK